MSKNWSIKGSVEARDWEHCKIIDGPIWFPGSAIFLLLLNIISISPEENPKIERHRIWNDDGGEEDDDGEEEDDDDDDDDDGDDNETWVHPFSVLQTWGEPPSPLHVSLPTMVNIWSYYRVIAYNALWGRCKIGSKVANFDTLFLHKFWS